MLWSIVQLTLLHSSFFIEFEQNLTQSIESKYNKDREFTLFVTERCPLNLNTFFLLTSSVPSLMASTVIYAQLWVEVTATLLVHAEAYLCILFLQTHKRHKEICFLAREIMLTVYFLDMCFYI